MIEYIVAAGIVAVTIFIFFIKMPVEHYRTCEYCGRDNYLGTNKNAEFKRDHLKTYRCSRCGANLFEGKDE